MSQSHRSLNRFFVSEYFRTSSSNTSPGIWTTRLNRFFVSEYFRTCRRCSRRYGRLVCSLNRFFVSEYSRTNRHHCGLLGLLEVSIASSSANTPGRFKLVQVGYQPNVSIASSSANTPGQDITLLLQSAINCLNRFFVSEYSRTVQPSARAVWNDFVSIASSSANTPGQPTRQATESIRSEPPLSANPRFSRPPAPAKSPPAAPKTAQTPTKSASSQPALPRGSFSQSRQIPPNQSLGG